MPIVRRSAASAPPPPPPEALVDFGSPEFYSTGDYIVEGDYALTFETKLYARTNAEGIVVGDERMGVGVTFHPLEETPEIQTRERFFSMGGKAKLSFAPSRNGKGIVAIPGGPATTIRDTSSWGVFFKSLRDSGLPPDVFRGDLSVLDGIWVHISLADPPASWSTIDSDMEIEGMPAAEPRKVPIVTHIHENGQPWAGSGGVPTESTAAQNAGPQTAQQTATPKARGPVAVPKTSAKSSTPSPQAISSNGFSEEDVYMAALEAIAGVFEAEPKGLPIVKLRAETFKAIKDAELGTAVLDKYFNSTENTNLLIGEFQYHLEKGFVKPDAPA